MPWQYNLAFILLESIISWGNGERSIYIRRCW